MPCKISVIIASTGEQGEVIKSAPTIRMVPFGAATGHIQQLAAAIVRLEEFGLIDTAAIYIKPVDEGVD